MTQITWQLVQAEALRRIRQREWPPGSQIPHEAVLATELGCSRATVNRALRELAKVGMLERKRKAGTRVPLNPVRKATFEIPIIRQDIENRGQRHGYRLLHRISAIPPTDLLLRLELPPATEMLHVLALHLADDQPFCLEDRWINTAAVPPMDTADFTKLSANEWLIQNAGFTNGNIGFGATAAGPEAASHLNCAPGSALFVNTRVTFAGDAAITSVRLTYAPGYQMRAQI
tara:strand:+ start:2322 stop:3014 length:693 start_codon:yes stop_codon:yes gene_type:complete